MKVRRSENSNGFCGPAALSAITGLHVDTVVGKFQALRNPTLRDSDKDVAGVYDDEMTAILREIGYEASRVSLGKRQPTLAEFMQSQRDSRYLITLAKGKEELHFVVAKDDQICDSWYPDGVALLESNHRDDLVVSAWAVREVYARQLRAQGGMCVICAEERSQKLRAQLRKCSSVEERADVERRLKGFGRPQRGEKLAWTRSGRLICSWH